jgi:hypothetical protein
VRSPHLHLRGGDAPFGARYIELSPFGLSELSRSKEHQRRQPQRLSRDGLPLEAVDRAEQGADCVRLDDRSAMGHFRRDESTTRPAACRIPCWRSPAATVSSSVWSARVSLGLERWRMKADAQMVPLAGIEPALLAELDFESSASTSSATGAFALSRGRAWRSGRTIAGARAWSTRTDVIVPHLDRFAWRG